MAALFGSRDPGTEPDLQDRLKARILREWLLTTIALLGLTFTLCYFNGVLGLKSLNNTIYDRFLPTLVQRPASGNIVIVAIDDNSIQELGHWPWRRVQHAALVQRLSQARAVALDLVFSEHDPDYPEDDAILARAIQDHGRVVLPIIVGHDSRSITYPVPTLASAAARMGYINIYPDSDGVIRAFVPRIHLEDGRVLNHLSLELLETGQQRDTVQHLHAYGSSPLRIAYSRFDDDMAIVPYNRVLDGSIPSSTFEGKYVLVGSWGSGLGDMFATPHSSQGEAMSGVEILANLLNGGLTDQWISTPGRLPMALLCLVPVLISCLSFRYLSPQRAFLFTALVFTGVFATVALLLHYTLLWLPPSAALIGTILAYPVWSWRSQHAALHHIDQELMLLHNERLIPQTSNTPSPKQMPGRESPDGPSLLPHDQSLLARIKQLHFAIDAMRTAQRQRNETMRFLSHDMRAPLNSILALTELQRSRSDARAHDQETLDAFDHYANKTLALVDGFVALSRAEAQDLTLAPTNLGDLIRQCCEDVWVRARQKDIQIKADDLPVAAWVSADAGLLERAWGNLLDNALKYSPDSTTITCTLKREGNEWVADIHDQGRGMDAASVASAFSPFVRIDEDHPDNPTGVGLGLAFVRTVVARHNGHISVQSQPGHGTRFTIRLTALDILDPDSSNHPGDSVR